MAAKLFFAKSGSSVTRCHGQLSSCTTSEKSINPIFKKLSDGRADGYTDRGADRGTDRRRGVISYDIVRLTLSV